MITAEQARKIEAGFGHGHWAEQARAALKLLTASGPTRAAGRYDDDGEAEFEAEYAALFPPRSPAEAERRLAAASAARAALSDDAIYASIFPGGQR